MSESGTGGDRNPEPLPAATRPGQSPGDVPAGPAGVTAAPGSFCPGAWRNAGAGRAGGDVTPAAGDVAMASGQMPGVAPESKSL